MIKNGAGGANTNKSGLAFERNVDLANALRSKGYQIKEKNGFVQVFKGEMEYGLLAPKHDLYRYLEMQGKNWKGLVSKRLLPDNAFINTQNSTAYIIEVKFQGRSGSVDEKLQTCDYKLKTYRRLFNGLGKEIKFIYVLNDWFKQPAYRDTLGYIEETGCKYYYGEIPTEDIGL